MKSNLAISILILVAAVLLPRCQSDQPTHSLPQFELTINATLLAGTAEQQLAIVRTVHGTPTTAEFVQDAIVEVNGVRFENVPVGQLTPSAPFNYRTDRLPLSCGQVCSLSISYRHQRVTGLTRIPDTIEPVSVNGAVIQWQVDSLNALFSMAIDSFESSVRRGNRFDVSDFLRNYRPAEYRVRITVYDDNYRRIYDPDTGVTKQLTAGLEGAFGYFASACVWEGIRRLD